nr:S-S bond formation pathway protein [Wadden Sea poxvirus]
MERNAIPLDTLYNSFINRYLQKLSMYSTPTSISCSIYIGNIKGILDRCSFRITNKCLNNPRLSFMLMIESFFDVIETIPQQEKEHLANEIGIDIHDKDINKISKLEKKCTTLTETSNIININDFDIGTCIAPLGKHIILHIINSGSVEANCGLETIMRSMNKRYIPVTNIENKLQLSNSPWFIIGTCIVIVIFIIAICSFNRRLNIRYRYGSFLYV